MINDNNYKKIIGTILFMTLLIYLITLISPMITVNYKKVPLFTQEFVEGTVIKVLENEIEEDYYVQNRYRGYQKFIVRIDEGSEKGNEFTVSHTLSSIRAARAYEGLKAIFTVKTKANGDTAVWLYNYKRNTGIYILMFILVFLVIIIGRKEGLNSILALAFTAVVLLYIVVPGMWTPYPILITIISSIIICTVSFILIAGITQKALIAGLGTLLGITLAGLVSYSMGLLLNISGVDMDKGETLLYLAQDRGFQIKSLLFVSILISSLGATMDIAMTISSSAEQIIKANNQITKKELFIALLNVGKDIIGTMTNTLILAFCGASLPLAMMIWGYDMDYVQFINIPIIVINIVQAVSGSIGMITSVIFTSIVAIAIIYRKNRYKFDF